MARQIQPVRPPCIWPDSPPGATLLVRGESLAASMSDYRIAQLKASPSMGVRLRTPSCRRLRDILRDHLARPVAIKTVGDHPVVAGEGPHLPHCGPG